jgi:hypothetical protein
MRLGEGELAEWHAFDTITSTNSAFVKLYTSFFPLSFSISLSLFLHHLPLFPLLPFRHTHFQETRSISSTGNAETPPKAKTCDLHDGNGEQATHSHQKKQETTRTDNQDSRWSKRNQTTPSTARHHYIRIFKIAGNKKQSQMEWMDSKQHKSDKHVGNHQKSRVQQQTSKQMESKKKRRTGSKPQHDIAKTWTSMVQMNWIMEEGDQKAHLNISKANRALPRSKHRKIIWSKAK